MRSHQEQRLLDAQRTLARDENGADVVRQIGGDPQDKESVRAIVDWDREVDGATMLPNANAAKVTDPSGRRVPRYCTLELLATQEVRDDDKFIVDYCGASLVVNVLRQVGADDALKSVLCEYPGNRTTKSPRLRR